MQGIDENRDEKNSLVNSRWRNDWFSRHSAQVHLDLHTFASMGVEGFGARCNPKEIARQLYESGIELVCVTAMSDYCIYPTKVSLQHPAFKRDYLGEIIPELKERGLVVLVYVGATWNVPLAKVHPDWLQVDPEYKGDDPNIVLCLNSPWREHLGDIMAEITQLYPIDGFFLDMFGFYRTCHCQYCTERFRKECGKEIPTGTFQETPGWVKYVRWQLKCCEEASQYLHRRVKEVRPGVKIGCNCAFGPLEKFTDGVLTEDDFLVVEGSMAREAWDYWRMPLRAKYYSSDPRHRPTQIISVRFNYNWADWTIRSAHESRYEASTVMTNGTTMSLGETMRFDARIIPPFYEMAKGYSDWVKNIRHWCYRGQAISEIGLYDGGRFYCTALNNVYDALCGTYRTLSEGHWTFDIIHRGLLDRLSRYSLIVLERGWALTDQEVEAVKQYVADGGLLITCGNTGCLDGEYNRRKTFPLEEVLGAKIINPEPFPEGYFLSLDENLRGGIPDLPLRSRKESFLLEPLPDSRVIGKIYLPEKEEIINPMIEEAKAHPGIIYHRYGKGATILFSSHIGQAAWLDSYFCLNQLLANAIRFLRPHKLVETNLTRNCEISIRQDGKRLILHIVNCSPLKPGSSRGKTSIVHFDQTLPIFDIRIRLLWPAKCREVLEVFGNRRMDFEQEGNTVLLQIPRIDLHAIVVFEFDKEMEYSADIF